MSLLTRKGVTSLSELTIDTQSYFKTDIATVATALNGTATADGALYLRALEDAYLSVVCNHTNLTAAVLNSFCDHANLSSAKIKAILDTAGVTVASQLGAMLEGTQLTAANAATVCNEKYTDAQKAAAFDNAIMSSTRIAAICNEAGFTTANKALVFNEAGFTTANKALVFNEAGFTTANKALVFREAGLSIANINAIIIHANITDDISQQILSEITKANRDLTSAANIYEILDDWNDNKLTSRDGAGTTSTGFTNLFAHKNLFRPEWTKTETTAGNITVANGEVKFLSGTPQNDRIVAASTFTVGTWQFKQKLAVVNTTNSYGCFLAPFFTDTSNYYAFRIAADAELLVLTKRITGTTWDMLTSSITRDTSYHTLKLTRDASGNFEMFYGVVSKGTVTNTELTTTNYVAFCVEEGATVHSLDEDIYLDDLMVW